MIERLVIMGATGDLTARYLLPALASLRDAGELSDRFKLVAASMDDWQDDEFRRWAAGQLERHAGELPAAAKDAVVRSSHYSQVNVADPAGVRPLIAGDGPVAAYLALPPFLFTAAVSALHEAGLPEGSTIVLEKPFGENLQEAIELNRLLSILLPEEAVFRVDHFLAMTTVRNVLGTRLANRVLEPIWNSAHIGEIEIVWDESLALEGRAGYYDGVGALKDMLQNHLLQLLCLVAMEPPLSLNQRTGRSQPDTTRPLHGRQDRRPLPAVLRRRRRSRSSARDRNIRRDGARAGELALAGDDFPAPHGQSTRA
jgi:glucose-6-phosphate 1-dehydrogenase